VANRNLNARQQQKHDTSSNFNSKNATYLEGEILIESDTGRVKIADGDTDYKTLPYTIGTRVPTEAKFTDTTYNKATDSSLGLVQVGYSTSGKNYAVTLDDSGNAYVNVPWENTTYTNGDGLSLSGGTFSIEDTGVTADLYGPGGDSSPLFGGTFMVPYFAVNSKGQILTATNRRIKIPSNTFAGASTESDGVVGLVPAPSSGAATRYLRSDGTWAVPPNTTYANFVAATASSAGSSGLVPAPAAGKQTSFLRGDGAWVIPSQPTVNNPTITIKQDGTTKGTFTLNQSGDATIELTDTNTTYAQATSTVLGLVKIGYAENGRNYPIKLDSLGKMFVNVPWTDTTYSVATVSEDGLIPKIPSSSAQYLNGMGQWSTPPDTKYTNFVGSGTGAKSGLVPSPGATAGTTRYLREDGTWYVPPDTTYRAGRAIEISQGAISVTNSGVSSGTYGLTTNTSVNVGTSFTVPGFVVDQHGRLTQAYSRAVTVNAPNMTGATTSEAGKAGFVPGPSAGDVYRYLRANGTWGAIPVVNSQRDGLAPKAPGDSRKFLNGSGNWATPYVADIGYDGYLPKLSGIPSTFLNGNGEWAVPPVFKGYTTGVAGTVGYVPAPTSANKFLKSDGTWADVGFSGGTVANDTTFSSNVTISGELNYDGGFY
jgi:hypothetical protein